MSGVALISRSGPSSNKRFWEAPFMTGGGILENNSIVDDIGVSRRWHSGGDLRDGFSGQVLLQVNTMICVPSHPSMFTAKHACTVTLCAEGMFLYDGVNRLGLVGGPALLHMMESGGTERLVHGGVIGDNILIISVLELRLVLAASVLKRGAGSWLLGKGPLAKSFSKSTE